TSKKLYLANGDSCELDDSVIVREAGRTAHTYVGFVHEILQDTASANYCQGVADAVLIQRAIISPPHDDNRLRLPKLCVVEEWSLVSVHDLLCTVNIQHDCFGQHCRASGLHPVYQERVQTDKTVPIIEHTGDKGDFYLNTLQMCDTLHVQQFRISSIPLNEVQVIQQSVANVISKRQ
ncbi:hypothetical protein CPC08DRAFT_613458, partial [Agrocybe pediades]